ncbi:MAG: phage integrase family protein [Geminicoccaceae bacterium]|jgi:integrase|nr:phage integrase family protein [Geminicoccaceae bacterium]
MPAITISKRTVDQVQPGPRDVFLWDQALSGFGLKVTPAGGKVYIVQYRTGGRGSPTKRVTVGRHGSPWTPDQARRKAREILGNVAAGGDPAGERQAERQAQKAPRNTVSAVAEEWLKRDQASNRRLPEVERILARDVLPAIGDVPITDLRKRDVIELVDGIADRGSGIMANRTLAIVKRMLTWAAARDIIEANVAQFVEPPADETRRDRVLCDAELVEIWRAAEAQGAPYGAGVKLLMLTAARREEIFGLSEGELDLDGSVIRLPASRTKVKEGRTIPLSPPALAVLRALPRLAGPYLLSATGERPWCDFPRSKRYLDARLPGMAPWVLHDIRRSVATGLQRLGARLETIEAVLGHVSGSRRGIVGTYQRHAFATEARAALDGWGRHVEALLSGATNNVVAMAGRLR